jgi:hypothetical protein
MAFRSEARAESASCLALVSAELNKLIDCLTDDNSADNIEIWSAMSRFSDSSLALQIDIKVSRILRTVFNNFCAWSILSYAFVKFALEGKCSP